MSSSCVWQQQEAWTLHCLVCQVSFAVQSASCSVAVNPSSSALEAAVHTLTINQQAVLSCGLMPVSAPDMQSALRVSV